LHLNPAKNGLATAKSPRLLVGKRFDNACRLLIAAIGRDRFGPAQDRRNGPAIKSIDRKMKACGGSIECAWKTRSVTRSSVLSARSEATISSGVPTWTSKARTCHTTAEIAYTDPSWHALRQER
jgi:hypothetical protein